MGREQKCHEFDKRKTDEEKIEDLWHVFFDTDKRSFNEYFSEEYGFTCNNEMILPTSRWRSCVKNYLILKINHGGKNDQWSIGNA